MRMIHFFSFSSSTKGLLLNDLLIVSIVKRLSKKTKKNNMSKRISRLQVPELPVLSQAIIQKIQNGSAKDLHLDSIQFSKRKNEN